MERSLTTESDVDICRIRIEQAVEKFYLDWYFNHRSFYNTEFTYRIEQFTKKGEKYLRFRYGSDKNRLTGYIGNLDPALRACLAIRNKLCDQASENLSHILATCDLGHWFYKVPLYSELNGEKNKDFFIDFNFVMGAIIEKAKKIKPIATPMEYDLDNLVGFFIEEYPSPDIICRSLSTEIDLISQSDFLSKLDVELPRLLPVASRYAFNVEKSMGRYLIGKFLERPYYVYVDVVWKGEFYACRILNIAGFDKEKSNQQTSSGLAFSMKSI